MAGDGTTSRQQRAKAMAQNLTTIEPLKLPDLARPDRMPSLPAWVGSRIESVLRGDQKDASGKHRRMMTLPATLMLGSSERKQIEAHTGALRKTLDARRRTARTQRPKRWCW
jgi:hypothetical protein